MAASAMCGAQVSISGTLCAKSLRNAHTQKPVSTTRLSRGHTIRAMQLQSTSSSRAVENLSLKEDAEDSALKVFADETKGIVCYRTESGEIVCEGIDEGPHFYPPCGANFYMPDTRAAAILPLLVEVMYEI